MQLGLKVSLGESQFERDVRLAHIDVLESLEDGESPGKDRPGTNPRTGTPHPFTAQPTRSALRHYLPGLPATSQCRSS